MRTLLLVALAGTLALGCAGASRVKGRIVENGKPIAVEGQAAVMIYLIGADGQPDASKAYPMSLAADGSFELVGSGGEVPPGTYMVTIEVNGPKSTTGMGRYKGLFGYPGSPLRQQIKAGSNDLTVDLAKPGP